MLMKLEIESGMLWMMIMLLLISCVVILETIFSILSMEQKVLRVCVHLGHILRITAQSVFVETE